jgi:hypothetical protein
MLTRISFGPTLKNQKLDNIELIKGKSYKDSQNWLSHHDK